MKILVFGKTGQVATCLQEQADVIALGRDQADLTDVAAIKDIVDNTDADVIINAAAYTAVDKAETDTDTAALVNYAAVSTMSSRAAKRDIPFLHISTDYVFPGGGTEPWNTDAKTGPLGVYGATKLMGEEAIRTDNGRYAILRTSWVFSAHGNNFVKTMLRLGKERDALTIVGDQIGGPTAAADIAATLLEMARGMVEDDKPSGTYHVTPIPTKDYPTPATRPLNSRLNCATLQRDFGIRRPDWRASLGTVLKDLGEPT